MRASDEELSGLILRAWREFADMTSAEVARALHVAPSTICMWEGADRGVRAADAIETVRRYADGLGLTPHRAAAMTGLWRASGSPSVVRPRTRWAHNYHGPPGPVWAWLRSVPPGQARSGAPGQPGGAAGPDPPGSDPPGPDAPKLRAALRWGPYHAHVETTPDHFGVLVQLPASVPNPPLEITLEDRGWADFGPGEVPAQVAARIGLTHVRATGFDGPRTPWPDHPIASAATTHALLPFMREAARLARHLGLAADHREERHTDDDDPSDLSDAGGRHAVGPDAVGRDAVGRDAVGPDGGEREVRLDDALADEEAFWPGIFDPRGAVVSQMLVSPGRAQRIREARGYSRRAAAEAATALDRRNPLTDRMIESLEMRGSIPGPPCALSRLDTVYDLDGRFAVDRTFDSLMTGGGSRKVEFVVAFPRFWRGPIWVQPIWVQPILDQSVDGQPLRGRSLRTEPIRTEPMWTEPLRAEPVWTTPIWDDSIRSGLVRTEPMWTEPIGGSARGSGGQSGVCSVELTWGPWRRRTRIASCEVLTTRKATRDALPLHIRLPHGWALAAGIGAVPNAIDVNNGWYPHDIPWAVALIKEGFRAVRRGLSG